MATMKDVAELAGVSRGTVDRVLNNRGAVNSDTKKRILDAIEKLGYEPNKAGMVLATQKKKLVVGVTLLADGNSFYDEVIRGISEKLDELSVYGCKLMMRNTSVDENEQLAAIEQLKEEASVILISPMERERIKVAVEELTNRGIFVITVNTDLAGSPRLAFVGEDSVHSGKLAGGLVRLLSPSVENGSEQGRMCIVTGSRNIQNHENRVSGFSESFDKAKIDVLECFDNDKKSYTLLKDYLNAEHPNAIYFSAAGVSGGCRAIEEYMEKTQREIIVISHDEVPDTVNYVEKGIISATICQSPYVQGYRAMGIAIEKIVLGQDPGIERIYVDQNIKIKESFG